MSNIIEIRFNGNKIVESDVSLTQYDRGQILKFVDIDLPNNYIVHFSNEDRRGFARPSLGNSDGVVVPIKYLSQGNNVYAWIYLTDESSGKSEYKVIVPIEPRPMPVYDDPTPTEESFIEQVLMYVDTQTENIKDSVSKTEENVRISSENVQITRDTSSFCIDVVLSLLRGDKHILIP